MSETRPGPVVWAGDTRIKLYGRKLVSRYRKVKLYTVTHKTGRLLLLQVFCSIVALVGVAQYSVPIALIIGGVGGILAVERQSR